MACFDHFNKLNEKYYTSKGNETNFWLCVCNHCDREFKEKVAAEPLQAHKAPKKMPRNFRDCRNHLKKCEAFARYNMMTAPPRANPWSSPEKSSTVHAAGRARPGAASSSRLVATPPGSSTMPARMAALETKLFGQAASTDLDLRTRLIQMEEWTWGKEQTGAAVQRVEQLEQFADIARLL
jgi:hypothetical protein